MSLMEIVTHNSEQKKLNKRTFFPPFPLLVYEFAKHITLCIGGKTESTE
jgi:hypothetical protein